MDGLVHSEGMILLLVVATYVALLLALALRAERKHSQAGRNLKRAIGYALSLSVLCTSWTYFGAVGVAIRGGWEFLPNTLGPIIALTLLFPVWRRIARVARRENVNSVADFISSRYGKNRLLGALIALVSLVGALPYIALQFLALTNATVIFLGPKAILVTAPVLVIALAGLAILFGARRPTLTQHNRGLARVVSVEAIVKLSALIAVAVVATMVVVHMPARIVSGQLGEPPQINPSFVISTILCTVTVFSLPRVFHLGFVTLEDTTDLKVARLIFPIYMLIWAMAIVPIAIVGKSIGIIDSDTAVLQLPIVFGNVILANFAFLGGFSAGAAMVMVEVIALSAMLSNEIIIPWMTQHHWGVPGEQNVGDFIVLVRRIVIVLILLLAYAYFLALPTGGNLPRLGFTSLAASAQIVPALLGGVLWRNGHARGALWSISIGMAIWFWGIVLPQLGWSGLPLRSSLIPDPFDLAICLSIGVNLSIYVVVSMATRPSQTDLVQANAFVETTQTAGRSDNREMGVTVGDLRALLHRFIGPSETTRGLGDFSRNHGRPLDDRDPVTPMVARIAERLLGGAIGASSARSVIGLALAGQSGDVADVNQMLDEAADAVQFNRDIVHAALNNIDHGISVVDDDLRLVAWNQAYLDMFQYSQSEVYVGRPLRELIEFSAELEGHSGEARSQIIERRMGSIERRESQSFERRRAGGGIIRIVGRPLATGEYVTSFSDVTEVRAAEQALHSINEELEQRVQDRTRELTRVNDALSEAKALADRVVAAQNRFVASASHDLLQPLHAARLFIGSGLEDADGARIQAVLRRADMSVESADRLLKALLNLSKIEVGGIEPELGPVALEDLLFSLAEEFEPLASSKGLTLQVAASPVWCISNADLLRSVLQNLISNAIRYTDKGRVLIGVRREGEGLRIEVRDTGPGMPADSRELIFAEYTRLEHNSRHGEGAGLGLSIVKRICTALRHSVVVDSKPGRGTIFSVSLPRAAPPKTLALPPAEGQNIAVLSGLRVLCVEDQVDVLDAQTLLLRRWGVRVTGLTSGTAAVELNEEFDAIIADYHLGEDIDGIELLGRTEHLAATRVLLTSDITETVRERAADIGAVLLRKPASAGALRALLMEAARKRDAHTCC